MAQTFLKPTRLAPIPLLFRDDAVVFRDTRIDALVLHCPLKETLAALTGYDTVVEPSRFVLANHADLRLRVVGLLLLLEVNVLLLLLLLELELLVGLLLELVELLLLLLLLVELTEVAHQLMVKG